MTTLILGPSKRQVIATEATSAFPAECCGLLIGKGGQRIEVIDVIPTENHAESHDRFLVDPQVQFEWIRRLRGTDQRLVGHYHSHPNGRRSPSQQDEALALEPGQIWVIAPIEERRVQDILAFEVSSTPGAFSPVAIVED